MSDLKWLSRTELLIGKENIDVLQNSHVLIVGLGGVGSFAAEYMCRAGVGSLTIVDGDVVDTTNRNRQLPAMASTIGKSKVTWMAERLLDINPELNLIAINEFLTPVRCEEICGNDYDYVLDCIDSVTPKLTLLSTAYKRGLRIVSSMGAGGKMDPTQLKVADLFDTNTCTLAQYVRKRLKKMDVGLGIKAVFSKEEVDKNSLILTDGSNFKLSAYGTISYLPAAFGGVVASVAIRDLLGKAIHLEKRPKNHKKSVLTKNIPESKQKK